MTNPLGTATCTYSATQAAYLCNLKTPKGVATNAAAYYLTVQELLGGTWVSMPNATGVTTTNTEPIMFKQRRRPHPCRNRGLA